MTDFEMVRKRITDLSLTPSSVRGTKEITILSLDSVRDVEIRKALFIEQHLFSSVQETLKYCILRQESYTEYEITFKEIK